MKYYLVDAFTDSLFSGNPAGVCVLEQWPSDEMMQRIAGENNLPETAFLCKEENGWRIRSRHAGLRLCDDELCRAGGCGRL